jgi:hypothetical protein
LLSLRRIFQHRLQRRQSLRRGRLDRIRDADQPRRASVHRDEDRYDAIAPQRLCIGIECTRLHRVLAKEAGVADQHLAPVDASQHALAHWRIDRLRLRQHQAALCRRDRKSVV